MQSNSKSKSTEEQKPQSPQSPTGSKKKKKSSALINIVLTLILLIGAGLIAYPSFSDWWNSMHQSQAIAGYVEQVADLSEEQNQQLWDEAVAYNKVHNAQGNTFTQEFDRERRRQEAEEQEQATEFAVSGTAEAPANEATEQQPVEQEAIKPYDEVLNVTGTGIMGYINIPKINVNLPIYHGTDETVLQIAIGHLEGTSLPIGGKGSHTVLSGHRGLPSAKLFTDIDQLVEGDIFTLQILNHTLTYEVDQIKVVLPTEVDELEIKEEQDYCTLVTCTPYGVNTHRMLVRGHRIANIQDDAVVSADAMRIDPYITGPILGAAAVALLIIWLVFSGISEKLFRSRLRRFAEKALKEHERQERE